MDSRRVPGHGRAKLTLGLSVAFAVGAFVYFWLADAPLQGAGLAVLVLGAGYWEYKRKLQDERTAERFEQDAEARREKNRR